MSPHVRPVFAQAPCPAAQGARVPVVIVGAGPVGLALAIDLAQQDIPVIVLDDDDTVSEGSRAICWSKRTLEIFDRLGVGEASVTRGVRWNVGRVFFGGSQIFDFDLLPEAGHRRPAFVNLQQYHVEQMLVERGQALDNCTLRWKHRCDRVEVHDRGVHVEVATPDGPYAIDCDWLVACDGARSTVRTSLGLESRGHVFRDRFLIADIRMQSPFPAERWFWFDPPFHRNQSALLHRQADDVWRIDFQLGDDADAETEKQPARVAARVRAMLGEDVCFDIEWASVYTFACRRLPSFRHARVLFAGDSAHLVSPFGARGANSGVQDADNLGWKLARVIRGSAPETLIDSYDVERGRAADENIRHSTRATDFITPKSPMSRLYRDSVLELARRYAFARRWVNSGRLSTASVLRDSPLSTPDRDADFAATGAVTGPGMVAADAPVSGSRGEWLVDCLGGRFVLLVFGVELAAADLQRLRDARECDVIAVRADATTGVGTDEGTDVGAHTLADVEGHAAARYDARPGTCYLVRPDQHVCARWRVFDAQAVIDAIDRACGVA